MMVYMSNPTIPFDGRGKVEAIKLGADDIRVDLAAKTYREARELSDPCGLSQR